MKHFKPMSTRALALSLFAVAVICARADRYEEYIDCYAPVAVAEMEAFGIPASITLAQGLLESAAGQSALAVEANNHFGIKCHRDWTGPTMLRDDDAKDECFRAYAQAAESFRDHSLFLTRKRYRPLFELPQSDYASWARVLRECGYATDPHYADRLIAIIERYALYSYDDPEGSRRQTAEFIRDFIVRTHKVLRYRGLHYVVAVPGDSYASIAAEFGIDPHALAGYNDRTLPEEEVHPWQEVYLQAKLDTPPQDQDTATIGTGETMHSLSQRFGMTLQALRRLNPKSKDRPGTRLRLKAPSHKK